MKEKRMTDKNIIFPRIRPLLKAKPGFANAKALLIRG